jgi:leader peptidase (prepilin peptidase)/N-methyltransferase
MTAWGVVAVCGIGGGAAGPFLDALARRVRRPPASASSASSASSPAPVSSVSSDSGHPVGADVAPRPAPVPSEEAVRGAAAAGAGAPPPRSIAAGSAAGSAAAALVTAAACALAAVRLGAVPALAAYCVLAGALVTVSITDLRTGLVPRRIVYAAAAGVGVALLAASAVTGVWRPTLDALLGAAVAFCVFGAVWWLFPKAMGFGDVRLAGLCGGALGWLGFAPIYLGFLAAFVVGALVGIAVLLTRGHRRFPFAPSLALGTMFGVLWGTWLGSLWFHVS